MFLEIYQVGTKIKSSVLAVNITTRMYFTKGGANSKKGEGAR